MTQLARIRTLIRLALTMLPLGFAHGQTVSPAFTYQGRLNINGQPITGEVDIIARLFNAESGGSPIGTVDLANVPVDEGLFTVQLGFGVDAVASDAHWLEFDVRNPAGSGSYITLSPRQPLTAKRDDGT